MSEMKARIARASLAQGVTALIGKATNMVLAIALARLLFPEDYGLFTITLVVTGLANMLSHFGFQSYIIQAKELTTEAINTCYTLNLGFSIVLGLVVAGVGLAWSDPPPLLPVMLCMYALLVFLSGLTYIELALMKRDLDFTRSSRADLSFTLVSMSGRVGFAAAGLGALCFPLGDVLGGLVRFVLVRRMSKARLKLAMPSRTISGEALWFGMHATSVGLASFVANQSDKVLITANHPVAAVGLYGFGSNTAAMFYNAFIIPQTSVFQATFARLRDDLDEARRVLGVATRLIFSTALPLNVLWLLEAERLLLAIFGPRWVEAAPLIQVFAIDYLVRSMFSGITGLQMSFGLASEAARTKWANALVFVIFLLAATWIGTAIVGYAIAYVSANVVATAHNLHVNGRLLQLRWGAYALNLLPPALIALASTGVWWLARPYLAALPLWPAVGALAGAWLGTYLLLTIGFNRMVFTTMLGALRKKTKRAS